MGNIYAITEVKVHLISFVIVKMNLRLICQKVLFLLPNCINTLCHVRAPPFPILNISKIGKETAIDGRKRKILYRTEWANL